MPEIATVAKGPLRNEASGDLVRMLVANGTKKIIRVSPCVVGHKMAEGAVLVDKSDNPIPATKMHFKKTPSGHPQNIHYDFVFDPGPQYNCVFSPKAPPQHAMMYKA